MRGLASLATPFAPTLLVSPRNEANAAALVAEFPHMVAIASNAEIVARADVVVVAVRPQVAEAVLADLVFRPGCQLVLSVVATASRARIAALTRMPPTQVRTQDV